MPQLIKARIAELFEEKKYSGVKAELEKLNEVDIAELFDEISREDTVRLFRLLNKDVAADVFAYMDTQMQQHIIEVISDKELQDVLADMFLDDTVDLFGEMPANLVSRLLRNAPKETRVHINQYLNYPDNSAGSMMTI